MASADGLISSLGFALLCLQTFSKVSKNFPESPAVLDMNPNTTIPKSPTAQNRRLQVEDDLNKIKLLLSRQPKDYEQLVSWKMEAENWIIKMDTWMSDFQIMSSAFIKPKLVSTYKKLNELFEKFEKEEEEIQKTDGSLYHHNLAKRDAPLTNEEYEILFSKPNNSTFEAETADKSK